MGMKTKALLVVGLSVLLTGSLSAQQKPDEIPDAPSATRPVPPPEPPSPRAEANESNQPTAAPARAPEAAPAGAASTGAAPSSKEPPHTAPDNPAANAEQKPAPPPMPPITTVPAGSVPRDSETQEDLYKITTTVNLVLVPVTVKDNGGRMVNGLLPKDFTVRENGQPQKLRFFTSDPFALSAAVIIDLGMPDVGVRKVQQTLSALQGAFSQFDEVAIYTYSNTVGRASDFTSVGKQLTAVMNEIKSYSGANNGPPVTSGPLGPQGPIINGRPLDSPMTPVITPPKVARVLNDAILMAARDLSKRERTRRKILFVISDGRELGSTASYSDTLKVLLTQNITVYAVGVESAAIPVYGTLEKIHLPKTRALVGYGDILPKYVSATGGGTVYDELSQADIERAYAKAVGDARNQYTLGYTSKPGIGGYRHIEVIVHKPDLKVYAKDGYYPLPAAR